MSSTFDMTQVRRAARRLADETTRTKGEVLRMTARGFVKDIVKFTPPASKGATGSEARKRGEKAIDIDTGVTMEPMTDRQLQDAENFHGSTSFAANEVRNKKAGSISPTRTTSSAILSAR